MRLISFVPQLKRCELFHNLSEYPFVDCPLRPKRVFKQAVDSKLVGCRAPAAQLGKRMRWSRKTPVPQLFQGNQLPKGEQLS
jgi:hypothetical protein